MVSAIGLILIGQLLLGAAPHTLWSVAAVLFVYFLGFKRAGSIAAVARLQTRAWHEEGAAAAGVYNTTQSIGLAIGGVIGGWLLKVDGRAPYFSQCSGWFLHGWFVAANMKRAAAESPAHA